MSDWTGNAKSIYTCNGASNHTNEQRESYDYYATEPKATEILLEQEKFNEHIWECACGEGHMTNVLQKHGYIVKSTDIIDRGAVDGLEVVDFLKTTKDYLKNKRMDIITNPPYKFAKDFVEHALDIVDDGAKVALFLKLTFLESKTRKELFKKYPPKVIYVSSSRLQCAKNGIL